MKKEIKKDKYGNEIKRGRIRMSKKTEANRSGFVFETKNDLLTKFNDYGYFTKGIDGGYEIYKNKEEAPIAFIYKKKNIFAFKNKGFRNKIPLDIEKITLYIPEPEWLIFIPKRSLVIIIEYKVQNSSGSVYWKIPGQALILKNIYKKIFSQSTLYPKCYYLIGGKEINNLVKNKKGDFLEIIRVMREDLEIFVSLNEDIKLEDLGFKKLK